ncbi:MAG TPA: sugar phosphate isomerase/epimerase [Clostridiales bacterium]|nr:sugar phosphate isomerase/epimerase [Clostridiales bacterium]
MSLQIAAQLYTVRDFMKVPADMKESLMKIKKIGYRAVQVSGVGPVDPAEFKAYADEAGLVICATHVGFSALQNDLESVIRQHKTWQCKYAGIGGMPAEYRTEKGYSEFARIASEIGKKLADNGLQLIYHNHNFEFERFGNRTGLDILIEESDPAAFHLELDTFWVQSGGGNPVDWILKAGNRMKVAHFKDYNYHREQKFIFAEIGNGNLNWDAIIAACKKTGVEWAAVEQDVCPGNPFDSLETSFRFLASKGLS